MTSPAVELRIEMVCEAVRSMSSGGTVMEIRDWMVENRPKDFAHSFGLTTSPSEAVQTACRLAWARDLLARRKQAGAYVYRLP